MGRFRSVMKHNFSQVPSANIQRSKFNRSHGYKTTFDAGKLIPIFLDEVLPGDTFRLRASIFARIQPLIVPIMDNMFLDSHFFHVPCRLVWDNWEKFNGQQDNPGDSIDFVIPQMVSPASTGYVYGSNADYFGLPTGVAGYTHSALPFRCLNLIWKEWFRDENLQDSPYITRGDGPDLPSNYPLLSRGKRHDYFTSCLPWPQKGPAVILPLGDDAPLVGLAPIYSNRIVNDGTHDGNLWQAFDGGGGGTVSTYKVGYGGPGAFTGQVVGSGTFPDTNARLSVATKADYTAHSTFEPAYADLADSRFGGAPYADLSSATAATINAIRTAFQIQRMYEHDARGGTRYTEIIRAHFGVVSPDARLQRPEYLGGSSVPVSIHPVAQTSATVSGDTPQANLAAMGTIAAHGHGFTKSFTEHGYVLGFVSVRADLNYQQGLNFLWSRTERFHFYFPTFAHLGEQAVKNKELFLQGTADDELIFGYQERYAEYRYKPSLITGKFRSSDPQSLDVWHLAQDFSTLPVLNDSFIVENPPISRVVAVPTEPQFLLDAYFDYECARPMPAYSVPGLVDHF